MQDHFHGTIATFVRSAGGRIFCKVAHENKARSQDMSDSRPPHPRVQLNFHKRFLEFEATTASILCPKLINKNNPWYLSVIVQMDSKQWQCEFCLFSSLTAVKDLCNLFFT
jgi:hypothetical protein